MASDVIKGLVCQFTISPRRIVPRNLIGDNVFRGKARKRTINDVMNFTSYGLISGLVNWAKLTGHPLNQPITIAPNWAG